MGINFAVSVGEDLDKLRIPYVYPFPPFVTVISVIVPALSTVIETLPPVPSPKISAVVPVVYPVPPSSIYTAFIWLLLISEFPPSLIVWILESVVVNQSLGTVIYSVESNLITSDGVILNRYFHLYPSDPATDGSTSVCVGSIVDPVTVGLGPEEPLSIQI